MALVNSLLSIFSKAISVAESAVHVEKTKVAAVKAEANDLFQEGYENLKRLDRNINSVRVQNQHHAELIVLAAEAAFATENRVICRQIVEEFLLKSPQHDQYYCRAKIILGLLIDFEADSTYGEASLMQRKLALVELLVALDVATLPENKNRYQFIVFNVSVECWKIVRQFLRITRAKFFVDEMVKVCNSLETLEDVDKNWLINFYAGTSYCLGDAESGSKGSEMLDKAIALAENAVAEISSQENSKNDEVMKLAKDIENTHKRIHAAEERLDQAAAEEKRRVANGEEVVGDAVDEVGSAGQNEPFESLEDLNEQLKTLQIQSSQLKDECKSLVEKKMPLVDRVMRLYMQRVYALPSDAKRLAGTPQITQSLRMKSLALLHCMLAGCIPPNEHESTLRSIVAENEATAASPQAAETLFDCCRIARNLGGGKDGGALKEISVKCAELGKEMVRSAGILTAVLLVKQDLCTAVLMVDDCNNTAILSGSKDELDGPSAPLLSEKQVEGFSISNRLEAIKLLERVLSVCQSRVKDAALTQEICIEIWNTIYPLIQPHLRKRIHRSIQLISAALSEIDSPLLRLRAQVHYELARCEEAVDFVVKAHTESVKALNLDYGGLANASTALAETRPVSPLKSQASSKALKESAPPEKEKATLMPPRKDNPGFDSDRPLDVYLDPLAETLFLRSSVYSTPDTVEDQVATNLQQIRESSSKRYKKEMLSKSASMMFETLKNEDNDLYQQVEKCMESQGALMQSDTTLQSRKSTASSMESTSKVKGCVLPLSAIDGVIDSICDNSDDETKKRSPKDLLKLTQKRVNIMTTIAVCGHVSQAEVYRSGSFGGFASRKDDEYKLELCYIVEKSLLYILSQSWKPRDVMVRKLIVGQIEAACMLAESLINRMDSLTVCDDDFIIIPPQTVVGDESVLDDEPLPGSTVVDPRAMGIRASLSAPKSSFSAIEEDQAHEFVNSDSEPNRATKSMMDIKRMVIKLLRKALALATEEVDVIAVQNVIIYFWNINIHVFRKSLYHLIMPECVDFLQSAVESLEVVSMASASRIAASGKAGTEKGNHPTVDRKLQVNLIEALALAREAEGNISQAMDTAMSGCAGEGDVSVYVRRRLCELVSRLSVQGGGGAAGKGGKKGSVDSPIPVFDHPILNTIGLLVVIEIYGTASIGDDASRADLIPGLIEKATVLMKGEVMTAISKINNRVSADNQVIPLTQEENDQFQEMLVACWARLARANLKVGNIYGTNSAAIECMQIVHKGITAPLDDGGSHQVQDSNVRGRVHKRVWRWASLCERFMGIAISRIIKAEGQEKGLRNQLMLASLRHLSLSCQFAENAEIDSLIIAPAIDAWNISMPLVDEVCSGQRNRNAVQKSLITLQKQIIKTLLFCTVEEPEDEDEEDDNAADETEDRVNAVKLRFYLAVIEEYAHSQDWKEAMNTVLDAFSNVPVRLQKPLWKWRVIVMSKLGKSVLDGIQKLKENDPTLQARVYAILARSASKHKQQLEAYRKVVEILRDNVQRVEYMLETAQWICSAGMPRVVAVEILLAAVDALYEIEEQILEEKDEGDGGMSESSRATTRTGRSTNSKKSTMSRMSQSSKRGGQSRRGTALLKSRSSSHRARSEKSDLMADVNRLNMLQLDQAIRGLAMLSVLEHSSEKKVDRCIEGVFFVERALNLWQGEIDWAANDIAMKFASESSTSKDDGEGSTGTKLSADYVASLVNSSRIPTDAVDLVSWTPSKEFNVLMVKATERLPLMVPSKSSLQALQLTVYYMGVLADSLERNGYPKSALLCLAWARLCLMYGNNIKNPEPIYSVLHFRTMDLLSRSNAIHKQPSQQDSDADEDECVVADIVVLPSTLGDSTTVVEEFVSNIASKSSDFTPLKEVTFEPDERSLADSSSLSRQSTRQSSRGSRHSSSARPTTVTKRNPFDIPTWTKEYSSEVDELSCYIDLCKCMLNMGLLGKCKRIATFVVMESQAVGDIRSHIVASTILADIYCRTGNAGDAVRMISSIASQVELAGDCYCLSLQSQILIKCYAMLSNPSEASRVAAQSLDVLMGSALARVSASTQQTLNPTSPDIKTRLKEATVGASPVSASLVEAPPLGQSVSNTNISTLVSDAGHSTKAPTSTLALPSFEFNTEATEAFIDVAFTYLDEVLVPERLNIIKSVNKRIKSEYKTVTVGDTDVKNSFALKFFDTSQIESVLEKCETLAVATDGERSILHARVLHKTGNVLFTLYTAFHCIQSKSTGADNETAYVIWIDQMYSSIASKLEAALDIYTGMHTRVPLSEVIYMVSDSSTSEGSDSTLHSKRLTLSSNIMRSISRLQIDLEDVLLHLNILRAVYIPPPVVGDPSGKLNAIEKYLEQCRPSTAKATKSNVASFHPSAVDRCLVLSASTCEWMNDWSECIESNIVYNTCRLASRIEAGESVSSLCTIWHRILDVGDDSPSDGNIGDEVSVGSNAGHRAKQLSKEEDIVMIRELEAQVMQALYRTQGARYFKGLRMGALYLTECSGKRHPSTTASYMLTYQSIVAREWLYGMWRSVLSPSCETACSLNRIESLLGQHISSRSKIQRRLDAEYSFLQASSPVWQRLSITERPMNILQSPFLSPKTCVLSLQFCPLRRTLYACAGFPKVQIEQNDSDESGDERMERLPGVWYVDKMVFDETKRREFQVLAAQHALWVEQTTKLVTTYGEGMVEDMDFDGYSDRLSNQQLSEAQRTLLKAEHALEEELRSLVEHLSTLLNPLIGPGSEIDYFINQQLEEFNEVPAVSPKVTSGKKAAKDAAPPVVLSPNVILLMGDECMQSLPFEALPCMEKFGGNISRDFSVHIFGNRMKFAPESSDRMSVASTDVYCIVDPFGDDPNKNKTPNTGRGDTSDREHSPRSPRDMTVPPKSRTCIANVVHSIQTQVVPSGEKWAHAVPTQRRGGGLSLQDFISVCESPSPTYDRVVFAYAPGKVVGSLITPKELVNIDMSRVAVMIVADMTQTDGSYRRQLAVDSRKTASDIAHESPLAASVLYSLVGVSCVVSNQWCTTPTVLENFATTFWKEFSTGSASVLEATTRSRNAVLHESSLTKTEPNESNIEPATSVEFAGYSLRKWAKYSKVVFGLANVYYTT